jgi:hypothetical protein
MPPRLSPPRPSCAATGRPELLGPAGSARWVFAHWREGYYTHRSLHEVPATWDNVAWDSRLTRWPYALVTPNPFAGMTATSISRTIA